MIEFLLGAAVFGIGVIVGKKISAPTYHAQWMTIGNDAIGAKGIQRSSCRRDSFVDDFLHDDRGAGDD